MATGLIPSKLTRHLVRPVCLKTDTDQLILVDFASGWLLAGAPLVITCIITLLALTSHYGVHLALVLTEAVSSTSECVFVGSLWFPALPDSSVSLEPFVSDCQLHSLIFSQSLWNFPKCISLDIWELHQKLLATASLIGSSQGVFPGLALSYMKTRLYISVVIFKITAQTAVVWFAISLKKILPIFTLSVVSIEA